MTYITTDHLGFLAVKGELASLQDYSNSYWNWVTADNIFYEFLSHTHDGEAALSDPVGALVITTAATGGILPGGTSYYFVVTYLDALGRETGKSSEATITTAAALAKPATPTYNNQATPADLVHVDIALTGGDYWYKIAYTKGAGETLSSLPVYVNVPTDQTYAATIHFVSLAEIANGATGIIIYRKIGSGTYDKLITITNTATDSYQDDNTAVSDCAKHPVAVNTTNSFNTITIDWSALDYNNADSVRVFVNTVSALWTTSSNKLVTNTFDLATPITSYIWTGTTLLSGRPPVSSECFASPSKIDLTSEVDGRISLSNLPNTFSWGQPVTDETALNALAGVINGEVRLVKDSDILEYWDGDLATPTWVTLASGIKLIQLPYGITYDITGTYGDTIWSYLPIDNTLGDIVAVVSNDTLMGDYYKNVVYLYMWRENWTIPGWQLINPVLPSIASSMTTYSNYSAPPGSMWLREWAGVWTLNIMQANGNTTTVPNYTGIENYFGYYGTSEGAVNWGEVPNFGYGALTFYWDDKSFYYYTDDATPVWTKLIGPSGTTVADVTESATPTDVELKLNELLSALRDSGIIDT